MGPEQITQFLPNVARLSLKIGQRFSKGQNCEKVVKVRNLFRVVSVSWKLGMTEEEKVACSDEKIKGTTVKTPKKKAVLGSSPGQDSFCGLEITHDRRTVRKTKNFRSCHKITGTKVTNPRNIADPGLDNR
jgi:hypothetical protein